MRTLVTSGLALLALTLPRPLLAQWSSHQVALVRPAPFDLGIGDEFGSALGLDGPTLVVGAHWHDLVGGGVNDAGAWVWRLTGGAWVQETKLTPAPGSIRRLGYAVAVDGERIAIGAPDHDAFGSNVGAAYVYTASSGAWSLQAKLSDSGATFVDNFGAALDLDGDRLVVGLPYDAVPGVASGAVQFFTRSGSVWSGHFEMIGIETDGGDFMGSAVAISGVFVAAGAPDAEPFAGAHSFGEAYVFQLTAPPAIESYCTPKTNSLG